MEACTLEELRSTALASHRRASFRPLFPHDRRIADLVVDAAIEIASKEAGGIISLDETFEHESLFRLVRAVWKALLPNVSRYDLHLADACLGSALVFLSAVLLRRPELEPASPERLDALAMSLEARWREVWSRTHRADGEDLLEAALRESRSLRVTLGERCDGAKELHRIVAALAYALHEIEGDRPFALPKERIGAALGVPRQRIGEIVDRLVKWKVLALVSESDRFTQRAATYKFVSRQSPKLCLVNRQ